MNCQVICSFGSKNIFLRWQHNFGQCAFLRLLPQRDDVAVGDEGADDAGAAGHVRGDGETFGEGVGTVAVSGFQIF